MVMVLVVVVVHRIMTGQTQTLYYHRLKALQST
jgi:hypothetical protein